MSDDTYNGWSNYETWNVSLWLNNDEGLYSATHHMTTPEDLEYFVRGIAPTGFESTPYNLDRVDWQEIADANTES